MLDKLPTYVHITNHVSSKLVEIINLLKPDKIGLLVDENTKKHCYSIINVHPDILIEIESGEKNKNLKTCDSIWKQLTDFSFSRKSLLLNLGGGVIGDMGGFAAATYKRGIPFVNIPTTLLSQVDASIGGKQGVDYNGLKNHIGVFQNPHAVIIDSTFLNTLPEKQLTSGYAEVVKHALIYDATHWKKLNQLGFKEMNWSEIIPQSVAIKNQIVTIDPLEKGLRKILNFGHTLGHAIESYLLDSATPLLHGEAVAVGMILESHVSLQLDMISPDEYEEIHQHLTSRFELPNSLPSYDALMVFLKQDKKNSNGEISFSLLNKVGTCTYDRIVNEEQIKASLQAYTK